jgi:drug/metabolite transporter (DMT)-like permease
MVPVMLTGVVLRGKKYTWFQYLCVFMTPGGIALFHLAKLTSNSMRGENSIFGLVLCFVSLLLDGATGPTQVGCLFWVESMLSLVCQEKAIQKYNPGSYQLMLYTNLYALVFLTLGLLVTGEVPTALEYIHCSRPALITVCICLARTKHK